MRSIWNGAISFGLVSIPIKLVNATENHSISFRQIHTEDGGRIRYRKVCELEEREVTSAEIGKGYEDADGTIIPITDEDLSHLPLPTAKTIEIVAFVPADRIDPLQMDAAYYLQAGGAPAAKPYTLLREALKRSHKVAIAKYALRGRERLGMLRVVGEAIAMHGLLWPDEVRAPEGMAPDTSVTVRDNELDLADALMDTLGEVDLEDLHDEYREAVEEVVAAKAAGEAPPEAPAAPSSGKVLDLMAALEKSVRAAKESRGEASDSVQEPEAAEKAEVRRLPQRKSAGASPKQTGGKKSTSTARKSTAAPRKSTAKSAQAAKKTTASGSTARKTAARKTTSTAKKTTSGTSAKTTSGTSAKSASGTSAKAAAKKTAKKATSRKRTA
ncbi:MULTISPECIES: non-homologous end joining protein Ku [unclassified Streptomyces]|uniref:non-homologous end joining protein Ku n=1 Tax=unclassified Streptomyces TaxID=2593676 RepID=UPI002E2019D9